MKTALLTALILAPAALAQFPTSRTPLDPPGGLRGFPRPEPAEAADSIEVEPVARLAVTTPWQPLSHGDLWVYRTSFDSVMTLSVEAIEDVGGTRCARVQSVVDGQPVNDEWLAVDGDALRCYRNRNAQGDMVFGTAITRLKLPLRDGDTWTTKSKALDGSDVSGRFRVALPVEVRLQDGSKHSAARVSATMSGNQGDVTIEQHYVQGIGLVKQSMTFQGQTMTLELIDRFVAPVAGDGTPPAGLERASDTPRGGLGGAGNPLGGGNPPGGGLRETGNPLGGSPVGGNPLGGLGGEPVRRETPAAGTCAHCGHGHAAGAKFCGECGERLPVAAPACTGCGHELRAGAKFCGDCGTPVR